MSVFGPIICNIYCVINPWRCFDVYKQLCCCFHGRCYCRSNTVFFCQTCRPFLQFTLANVARPNRYNDAKYCEGAGIRLGGWEDSNGRVHGKNNNVS